MKKPMIWLSLVLLLAGTGFAGADPAHASEADTQGVAAAAERFYAALNAMFTGDAEPMKAVWSHADDITYMGPDGEFQHGWAEVEAVWEEHAAMKLGGKVTPDRLQITAGHDLAFTSNFEIGENFDKDGKPQKVAIRATNLFRKEAGQWKMIGHHTDLLPYLAKTAASQ